VEDGDFYGTGRLIGRDHGRILMPHGWGNHPSEPLDHGGVVQHASREA
jgi:hypothetical protein